MSLVSVGRWIAATVCIVASLAGMSSGALAAKLVAKPQIENVTAIPDTARTVRKIVSARAGGVIVATGADGTRFTLTIPKNALVWDEEISLTPWTMAIGFGGAPIIGFDVGPTGTQLVIPATVIIEPKGNAFVGKTRKDVKFFEGQGSGQVEARIAFPASGKAFGLRMFHFSPGGVFGGQEAIRAFFYTDKSGVTPDFVSREARAGRSTEQIIDTITDWQREIVQDRDAGNIDSFKAEQMLATTERLMSEATDVLMVKRIAALRKQQNENRDAAKVSEAEAKEIANRGDLSELDDFQDAVKKVLETERQDQMIGDSESDSSSKSDASRKVVDFLEIYLDAAAANCALHPVSIPVVMEFAKQAELLGADERVVQKSYDVISKCRPKKNLAEAIAWCYQTGDYQTLLNVYSILLRSDLSTTAKGPRASLGVFVPATVRDDMRQKVTAALNGCLKYDITIKVNSQFQSTSVAARNPPPDGEKPAVQTLAWTWTTKAAVKNQPEYDEGDTYSPVPFIAGSVIGAVQDCKCELNQPGAWIHSCKIKSCTARNDESEDSRFLYLKRLNFVGDQLRRLSIGGTATARLLTTTCHKGKCGETGGDRTPLLACSSAVRVKLAKSSTVGVWRGTGQCKRKLSDLDWQADQFEFEIRHTGKTP